ncbi:MAG: NAD-dependent protein deacylase [Desulfatiglandales bacterium]
MDLLERAAQTIAHAKRGIALTGAGISVESGIPDFRSADGLWSRYDPTEYATISAFRRDPEKVWEMLREMEELVVNARPNPAHYALAKLEEVQILKAVITQNIDNLHQMAGSKEVIEYHGNSATLSCLRCGMRYTREEKKGEKVPRCDCSMVLKPDVVFFGEPIPVDAMQRSFKLAASCDLLLIVGTSAVVSPANTIPGVAKQAGAKIIEVNLEPTHLTGSITDIFVQGKAGEVLPKIVESLTKYLKGR